MVSSGSKNVDTGKHVLGMEDHISWTPVHSRAVKGSPRLLLLPEHKQRSIDGFWNAAAWRSAFWSLRSRDGYSRDMW